MSTYGNTLALHDARPVWRVVQVDALDRFVAYRGAQDADQMLDRGRVRIAGGIGDADLVAACGHQRFGQPQYRSEEHTSELHSLMRISYALFCFTKNTIHHAHIITHTTCSLLPSLT